MGDPAALALVLQLSPASIVLPDLHARRMWHCGAGR